MAKYTLLKAVQKVLEAMDSDDVNSIEDTEEALLVASHIEEVFNLWISKDDWADKKDWETLQNNGDLSQPNTLAVQDGCNGIEEVYYNGQWVKFYRPEDFLKLVTQRTLGDDINIQVRGLGISNNADPQYVTSFDDKTLFFDSYDAEASDTLLGSNGYVIRKKVPEFVALDDFLLPIPDDQLPGFMAECKRTCFVYIKQTQSPIDEENAQTGLSVARRRKVVEFGRRKSKYGRK